MEQNARKTASNADDVSIMFHWYKDMSYKPTQMQPYDNDIGYSPSGL